MNNIEYLKSEIVKSEGCIEAITKAYDDLWKIRLHVSTYKLALDFYEKGLLKSHQKEV